MLQDISYPTFLGNWENAGWQRKYAKLDEIWQRKGCVFIFFLDENIGTGVL